MGVDVVTFGCRLNAFESEVIAREAEGAGLSDTIVINSCAVTNEAVAQARQTIRRLKRERPDARIVVTGCAAQTQAQMFADMPEVDRVIGNDDKMRGAAWRAARAALDAGAPADKIAVTDIMAVKEMAPHLVDGFQSGLPRVFVQVQNGCDHRCTFCIIPFGRGNSRSVPMGAVVEQVRALVERGHAEIVLTGVDLTSYGADLPGAPKLGHAGKADSASRAGAEAPAHLLDRFDRGGSRSARCHRRRCAADAASASVAAVRRRHDPEADEAAASARRMRSTSARRCGGCGRTSCSAPTSSRAFRPRPKRCLPARSISSRNAGSPSCTCFPIRRGRARRPRACRRSTAARSASARGGCARQARRRCDGGLMRRSALMREVLIESATAGPHGAFRAGGDCGRDAGRGAATEDHRA